MRICGFTVCAYNFPSLLSLFVSGVKLRFQNIVSKITCKSLNNLVLLAFIRTSCHVCEEHQIEWGKRGSGSGLAVARWTQSRRLRLRYCSGASFIKNVTSLAQVVPGPIVFTVQKSGRKHWYFILFCPGLRRWWGRRESCSGVSSTVKGKYGLYSRRKFTRSTLT